MLAAKLDQTQPLGIFSLVLSLIRAGQDVPKGLGEHFIAVVQQARELARAPKEHRGHVYPEAVELAVLLQTRQELLEEIDRINDFKGIQSDQASRVLSKMEHNPATQH
jgi:hypothetical protein